MAANDTQIASWYSISVTVAPDASEAIEYAFNSLEALGTEINHLRKKNAESVTVVGYFNELPDEERVQDELHYALTVYGFTEETAMQVVRDKIEETDWLAEWKKHWKPSDVGAFVIAPPWSDVDHSDKIVIRIEPNMAKDNATLNGIDGTIDFAIGSLDGDTSTFDFVCANLTLDVILPLLPMLVEKSGKTLVLSGILADQRSEIVTALAVLEIDNAEIKQAGEWISVVHRRES